MSSLIGNDLHSTQRFLEFLLGKGFLKFTEIYHLVALLFVWIYYQGLWDLEEDGDESKESCVLCVYVNVAFSKRTVWKGLPMEEYILSLMLLVHFVILVVRIPLMITHILYIPSQNCTQVMI